MNKDDIFRTVLIIICLIIYSLCFFYFVNLNIKGEWECDEILYPYDNETSPIVMINVNYRNHPFNSPSFKSWFCDINFEHCIADIEPNAYDEYCTKFILTKRVNVNEIQ